ncbi:MAG: hypothetical protein LBF93_00600 [Zoogloeaceae bacterium]|jgi:hypothetical protein|nr:hypothetical protein [Zoogloeaceae bacterium]
MEKAPGPKRQNIQKRKRPDRFGMDVERILPEDSDCVQKQGFLSRVSEIFLPGLS